MDSALTASGCWPGPPGLGHTSPLSSSFVAARIPGSVGRIRVSFDGRTPVKSKWSCPCKNKTATHIIVVNSQSRHRHAEMDEELMGGKHQQHGGTAELTDLEYNSNARNKNVSCPRVLFGSQLSVPGQNPAGGSPGNDHRGCRETRT